MATGPSIAGTDYPSPGRFHSPARLVRLWQDQPAIAKSGSEWSYDFVHAKFPRAASARRITEIYDELFARRGDNGKLPALTAPEFGVPSGSISLPQQVSRRRLSA